MYFILWYGKELPCFFHFVQVSYEKSAKSVEQVLFLGTANLSAIIIKLIASLYFLQSVMADLMAAIFFKKYLTGVLLNENIYF